MRHSDHRRVIGFSSALACAMVVCASVTMAGPINSNVAFTPRIGGSILRLQLRYDEASGHGAARNVNRTRVIATYVYGLKPKLALIVNVPYVNRQVDMFVPKMGRVEESHTGVGDITLMAKYRIFQDDPAPKETLRWALLGGLNLRSGDSDFSSDSYDPIVGTIVTWQRDRNQFDADLIYQFNTGRAANRHDSVRYDLVYSRRMWPAVFDPAHPFQVEGIIELNGEYTTEGNHEVYLSPGLQLIWEGLILETSLQLPVIQEFSDVRPETDYRLMFGVRFSW